jgi:hypothetical protein
MHVHQLARPLYQLRNFQLRSVPQLPDGGSTVRRPPLISLVNCDVAKKIGGPRGGARGPSAGRRRRKIEGGGAVQVGRLSCCLTEDC